MKILLVPLGSAGDVHPYIGVGLALRARGHDVAIVTSPTFAPLIERVGLRLIPLGTVDQFDAITRHPDLWNQHKGLGVIAEGIKRSSRELYRIIEKERRSADFILIGSGLAFAARVAHESLALRFVTMHLQPSCLVSVHDSPVLHPWLSGINSLPLAAKRPLLALMDRAADTILGSAARELCTEHGLPPARHITSRWWHSPQRVIGLFPDWFAPPQPDWPNRVFLTGFPLYDETGAAEVPPDVARFLDTGTPPVVYTAGSANLQATRFYAAAIEASQLLGQRAILLTRYKDQLPASLPDGVRHFDYVPFSQVLHRSAAVVHHGGIGTAAQGLAAGRPQLIMPMTFDQPDNARRLVGLGVARTLQPRAFRGAAVASAIDTLLGSTSVSDRCADLARRVRCDDPLTRTCTLIEDLG